MTDLPSDIEFFLSSLFNLFKAKLKKTFKAKKKVTKKFGVPQRGAERYALPNRSSEM